MNDILRQTLEFLGWRRNAYQQKFPRAHREQDVVLQDLAAFGHVNDDEPPADPALFLAYRAGQRSMWLRIQRHLNLSAEELFAIYNGVRTPLQKENRS